MLYNVQNPAINFINGTVATGQTLGWADGTKFTYPSSGQAVLVKPDNLPGEFWASSFRAKITTKSGNYTATVLDYTILCDTSTGTMTVTLPPAASGYNSTYEVGNFLNIKKIATGNSLIITGQGGNLIDGAAGLSFTTYNLNYTLQPNGVNWFLV